MNNLNSVLIEGSVAAALTLQYTPAGTPFCYLQVASQRSYKLDGERKQEVSNVMCMTTGKLAQVCVEHLDAGRGVRVVGRLKEELDTERNEAIKGVMQEQGCAEAAWWSLPPARRIVVVAEHVEFSPVRKPAPAPAQTGARLVHAGVVGTA